MPKLPLIALSLTFALAMSGCASSGGTRGQPTACPTVPKPPAAMMKSPDYESRLRAELLESAQKPTPK